MTDNCPICERPMVNFGIGLTCNTDDCPVLDDSLLWHRNAAGEWVRDPGPRFRRARTITAAELKRICRDWLDADDATHWGRFERELDELLERHD